MLNIGLCHSIGAVAKQNAGQIKMLKKTKTKQNNKTNNVVTKLTECLIKVNLIATLFLSTITGYVEQAVFSARGFS